LDEKVPADAHQKAQEVSEICGLSKEIALFALRKAAWDVYRTVDQLMDPGKVFLYAYDLLYCSHGSLTFFLFPESRDSQ
jgi:hypothetical protein